MTETEQAVTVDAPDQVDEAALAAMKETRAGRSFMLGQLRRAAVLVFAVALAFLGTPTANEWVIGLLLACIGEGIRIWSAGCLVKSRELITCGPYRFVRNPLYLGRFFLLGGVCVAAVMPYHANLVVLGVWLIVFFGYYIPRKERVEPQRLQAYHGDAYVRYRDAVPSLFPTFRAYDRPNGAWKWANFVRNQEPNVVIALLAFFAVLGWRSGVFAALAG